MLKQKGAMFGLDARIALAIFGALSVITGASLYSAIKEAKVVAIITELDNVDKAVSAYYLNTGIYPASNGTDSLLKATDLTVKPSNTPGWQGPYIQYSAGSTTDLLGHISYGDVALFSLVDATVGQPEDVGMRCLSSSASCSVYACINGVNDDMKRGIDKKVDGTDIDDDGKSRYEEGTSGYICLKGLLFDPSFGI